MKMENKSWYQIKALANSSAEISIYDEIGAWGVSAKSFMDELKSVGDVSDITLRLNSPGGSVFDGMAIYNQLKSHKAQITVYIDGLAASMASVIAMAGDLVVMPENAMLMIHNPWTMTAGDAAELRKNADLLDKIKTTMLSAYTGKTGKTEDEISALMDAETWFTGSEALAHGFADEAYEALDIAACVKNFDLSKFQNSPIKTSNIPSAVADNNQTEGNMPNTTEKATSEVEKIESAVKAALATETARKKDIVTAFGDYAAHHGELLQSCLMDESVTLAEAQSKLIKAMSSNTTPTGSPSVRVEVGKSGSERFRDDAVEALLGRAGMGKVSSSNPMHGQRLEAMARKSLELSGTNVNGMAPMQIVGAAFTQTSSDFPILLENAMHKVLQNAYATQVDTWSRFCATGSVSDFRAHSRYRVGSFGNLDSLSEAGEFKSKAIPDGEKASITAGTKGNIINLTRTAIINDDLGAFVNLAASFGRAARRTIEADVYALLAENSGLGPTMSDGKTLFHADHGNIGTGAALSVASIEADRVKMASQTDVSGNDYLDLRPEALLVPLSLGGTARVINDAQYDPDTANKLQRPNMVRGLFNDIIDSPRLAGTRSYMFANPMLAPTIEVAFLNGDQAPFLETENGFTVDGVRWKVRLDYGVAAIDYRGAVTNAGA
jgi:ATP-dependent Clp endopeptidase proteolytic subunit ClpP